MKQKSKLHYLNWTVCAVFMVGIIAVTGGCSTVTTGQTDHCIEQANNADVHGVSTADDQLNACLETYQLQRDKERTVSEVFIDEMLIPFLGNIIN